MRTKDAPPVLHVARRRLTASGLPRCRIDSAVVEAHALVACRGPHPWTPYPGRSSREACGFSWRAYARVASVRGGKALTVNRQLRSVVPGLFLGSLVCILVGGVSLSTGAETPHGRRHVDNPDVGPCDSATVRGWAMPDSVAVFKPPASQIERARRLGPGSDVRFTIRVQTTFEKAAGVWTYTYTVTNRVDSPRGIWMFTLRPVVAARDITGPHGWEPTLEDSILHWFCTDAGPNPPDNEGNVSPSPFDIAPGDSAVFSFASAQEPGDSLAYRVGGFHELPVAHTPQEEYDMMTAPPAIDWVEGKVIGPSLGKRLPHDRAHQQ
jgi:hypothetical protein